MAYSPHHQELAGAARLGLAIDRSGVVWVCRLSGDALGWIDPATGRRGEVPTGDGSGPRRIAAGPDGSLWIAFYGNGRLARLDPQTRRIARRQVPKSAADRAGAVALNFGWRRLSNVHRASARRQGRADESCGRFGDG